MAAVDEVAIKLGIKTGDLKAALADADASIKKFKASGEGGADGFTKSMSAAKKGLETFKQVLAGAGVVQLLRGLTDAAVKFAEDYKGAFDENVAATLRLKNSQQDLGSILQNVTGRIGVGLVGAMEKFGVAIGSMIYGTDAAADALNKMDAESRKAFDDAKTKKFREEQEKLAKVIRDNALAQADGNQKINILAGEFVKLLTEQSKLQKGSVEWVQKQIEVETRRGELAKADADQRKQEADDKKKRDEESNRAADETYQNLKRLGELYEKERDADLERLTLGQKQNALLKEEEELLRKLDELEAGTKEFNEAQARLLEVRANFRKSEADAAKVNLEIAKIMLVPEEKRSDIQKEQLKLLTGETTEYAQQLELAALLRRGVENLTEAEIRRLAVLSGQTVELKKQTDEEKQQAALRNLWANGIKHTGNVENLSNTKLDQLIQDLNTRLQSVKSQDQQYHGPGQPIGTYKSIEQYLLQQNLDDAMKELNLRRNFERTQNVFGPGTTERQFAPDDFARLQQLFNPDQAKKDSNNIAVIANGLQVLLPEKFNGAIR